MTSNCKTNEEKYKATCEFESADLSKVYNKWRSPLLSTTFELITAHRNLHNTNEKLVEKKKEKHLRELDLKKKWSELNRKNENFQNSVKELNEIFMVNKRKFEEAEKKLIYTECNRQCDNDIISLKKKLNELSSAEAKFKTSIKLLKPFKNMLEHSVQSMKEFKNIQDLVNYYEALIATSKNLSERLSTEIKDTENLRSNIEIFTKDKLKHISVIGNEISREQARNKNVVYSSTLWKNVSTMSEQIVREKAQDVEMVKLACNSICNQLLKWKRPSTILRSNDYINQLMYIKECMAELQQVHIICTDLEHKEKESCRADSPLISAKRET